MPGGQSAREPMERLIRLVAVLHDAGRVGVETTRLVQVAGFESGKDPVTQLTREFKYLRELGWQIENTSEDGTGGRYRLTTVDNQLRLDLSPDQQTALRRAVLMADRADLVEPLGLTGVDIAEPAPPPPGGDEPHPALNPVANAVRRRCLLRFRYAGKPRLVNPHSVRVVNTEWYLVGREDGQHTVKNFVVSRMSDVSLEAPRTAERPTVVRHPGLHPMSWELDPPVEVTLACEPEYAADVRRWLGQAVSQDDRDGQTELVYRVTHRAALRSRIYQLGTRVRLLGPDDVRQEMLDELAAMAGE